MEGEKLLAGAVLERAALDAIRGGDPGFKDKFTPAHYGQARNWFGLDRDHPNLAEPEEEGCYTFKLCCDILGLCPITVHRRLKAIPEGSKIRSPSITMKGWRNLLLDETIGFEIDLDGLRR